MATVKLLNFSVSEINYKNALQNGESFSISNRCSYNLGFTENVSICRGTMTLEISSKDKPDKFIFKIVMTGNFACDPSSPKDEIHRATYKLLFPHAKAALTAMTVASNIPPLFFPDIDIDSQSVYMIENPIK
jgi:hypothetical protein